MVIQTIMEDSFVSSVIELYEKKNWREIINRYHYYNERNKLLWVYPSEDNFDFIKNCSEDLRCDKILSIGCGSGLLEWMISEATEIPVSGVEVDGAWWRCKYAPPTFIPLLFTPPKIEGEIALVLNNSNSTALLFCYFNNGPAFEDYVKHFSGNVIIIIGPGDGKGVHTDPKPFGSLTEPWKLHKWEEVRDSRDFIAFYLKDI